jgi:AcrR family transcriptional regulator
MRLKGQPQVPVTRDPDRTRRRILAAALAEFSDKGFAGARVDAIARRAKGNKRMLYHYFGNKEALFGAVLRQKMAECRSWSTAISSDPSERLPFWFKTACADPSWVRLLEWESLQAPASKAINEKQRRISAAEWLQCLRGTGQFTTEFELCHLALAMQALTLFPVAFPQIVRFTTGKSVRDPKFQAGYRKFLRNFAAAFKPAQPPAPRK